MSALNSEQKKKNVN